jgi:hypothetical protein
MKRLLLSVGLMALASAAHAQLFTPGGSFTVTLENSPGSSTESPVITSGAQLLQGNALFLTVFVEDAGGGKQWLVFDYLTAQPVPLSQPGQNWSIHEVGLPAVQDVNFIADFSQFLNNQGQPFNQTVSIFGQTLMANPVPGFSGNGEGNSGFSAPFPAGPLPSLGAFADPFSVVTNALGSTNVRGFITAFEFEPQTPITPGVPEPSTWAMMALGFAGLGLLGYRRTRSAFA